MYKVVANCLLLILLPKLSATDCGCNKLKREVKDQIVNEFSLPEENPTKSPYDIKTNENDPSLEVPLKLFTDDEDSPPDPSLAIIPGGSVAIGTNTAIFHDDNESPEKIVKIRDFYMDKFEVSNDKFVKFVSDTGYITDAEKFGDSFVFKGLITKETQEKYVDFRVASAPWWYKIDKVDWRHPEGHSSHIEGKEFKLL